MDDLIAQFALEARELVQQATDDLLALEANPSSQERLESAFRVFHTLKGSTALFDFGPMLGVLHHVEDLLSQARGGRIAVDRTLIDPLLAVVEWVDDSIDGIVQSGRLPDAQERQATRLLAMLKSEIADVDEIPEEAAKQPMPSWAVSLGQHSEASDATGIVIAIRYQPHPECFFNGDDPLAKIASLPGLLHLAIAFKEVAPSRQDYDPFRCNLVIEALSVCSMEDAKATFKLIPDQVTLIQLPRANNSSMLAKTEDVGERHATTMRVDTTRIDKLVEIASELIIAKNSLVPLAEDARNLGNGALARRIASSHKEIERLVGSLYSAVTRARMIPLEQTFRRFPRLVRETSSRLGKAVDLVMEGETLEADREIVEGLFEPLLHLVRNSLDHGIEPEAERMQNAKAVRGRVLLRARQSGDQIEIEVADNGRGMNPEHLLQTAVNRGLVSASSALALSESEILKFVFEAGFSTASSVSDLSGRGVGLDVVQRSVQKLGGMLDLKSALGSGTSFILRLPISFSMKQLMVVGVDGERYGIPIGDVIETHKIPATTVQAIRAGHAFVLRDKTIPLLHLAELLQLSSLDSPPGDLKILIVQAGTDRIGIAVDEIAERAETLTRPLGGLLQSVPGIAGTTLLGDGRVLLVLNLEELVQ